jgi:thymidylate synthase
MHLRTRNVNTAFRDLVSGIHSGKIPTSVQVSRNGEVLVVEEPVILTYERPRERVLFNATRDANPFFHLYESLWMLVGRNDLAPLSYYCSQMKQFSDDGKTLNGAYGYRWRNGSPYLRDADPVDQIEDLVNHLKEKAESRRAVLQMWNVEDDLLKIDSSKDVCCNTHAYFSVEQGTCRACNGTGGDAVGDTGQLCPKCNGYPHDQPRLLNMTVCNRSNDLVLGMLGANAVHFSILQEYMAAQLGLEVGVYNQFTNNLHVYTSNWEPERWLREYDQGGARSDDWYNDTFKHFPLVRNPAIFDAELEQFVENHKDKDCPEYDAEDEWQEPFFRCVAEPMFKAFHSHKRKAVQNMWLNHCEAEDWKIAGRAWLERRLNRVRERTTSGR